MRLLAIPAFDDNYIWMLADDDGSVLIVDPGQAAPALAAITDRQLQPAGILLTHHHPDHTGGVAELRQRWPDLPVIGPVDERIGCTTMQVGDGDRFEAGGRAFQVIAVPGHTRSHIALFLDGTPLAGDDAPLNDGAPGGLLFSGDTLFSLGCGRLFEGSPAQMHRSLSRLADLPGDTRVCCGHEYTLANAAFARVVEPDNAALRRRSEEARAMRQNGQPTLPSTLDQERACNPFLRVDQPGVRAALRHRLGREPVDDIEAFAELRSWKDGFRA